MPMVSSAFLTANRWPSKTGTSNGECTEISNTQTLIKTHTHTHKCVDPGTNYVIHTNAAVSRMSTFRKHWFFW